MSTGSLEAKAEFLFRLRARGIRDLAVLRAMEAVPRHVFVPHRYADLAAKDVALPLACGQTMAEPSAVARMMEGLAATPACRILEIGSGSGYATAILARLGAEVLGVERFRTLSQGAQARLAGLGTVGATVVWGDGLAVPADRGPFDRILIHAASRRRAGRSGRPAGARRHGRVRGARPGPGARQELVAARRDGEGDWSFGPLGPCRLRPLYDGPSLGL